MSVWTHVAGIIRIDDLLEPKSKEYFEQILGKEIKWKDNWEELELHYNKFLPCGSEGSLEFEVWENPEGGNINRNMISIFGDLRDYDNINEIEKWFNDIIYNSELYIRQAVITIECENGLNKIIRYEDKYCD